VELEFFGFAEFVDPLLGCLEDPLNFALGDARLRANILAIWKDITSLLT